VKKIRNTIEGFELANDQWWWLATEDVKKFWRELMQSDKTVFEDDFSFQVWRDTYKDHKDTDVNSTFGRVSHAIASVETTEDLKEYWEKQFHDMLSNFKITAGGRIYSNAGTDWQGTTLMNCFVGPKADYDQDSLEGIVQTLLYQMQTLKSEGGWGMNFSFIRPRGSFIYGIGVESPGAVKYMEIFDKSSDIITAGSGLKKKVKQAKEKIRKGAMMGVLSCWHPDIEEFITAKLQEGRLSKFNISVDCTDEFMDRIVRIKELLAQINIGGLPDNGIAALEEIAELDKWDLVFPDTKHPEYKSQWNGDIAEWRDEFGFSVVRHRTISAIGLWDKIIQSTYTRNDPGVLFLDRANKTHCWNYGGRKSKIRATNPCGEQCLPFGAVCNLASLNLTQFVDVENKCFDLKRLKKYVKIAVRFLDDINSYTNAPLDAYKESIRKRRRIGLGVMGWGSALYMLRVRFGSAEAERIKAEVMRAFVHTAVETSVDLAEEKGMFEDCDPELHAAHSFWDQVELPQSIRNRMKKHGIRNSALFSIQPTGNTSIFANVVSGGLEPVFLHEYIRTVIVNTIPDEIKDETPKYWESEFKETSLFKFANEGGEQILRAVSSDGTVYKIDRNRGLTKEVLCEDYGVRHLKQYDLWDPKADWAVTTANLTVEDHITDLKGFGRWIDSSMSKTVNVPNDYPYAEFENVYLDAYKTGYLKGVTTYREGTMTTVLSSVEKKEDKPEGGRIVKNNAPKRPNELPATVHHITVKGEQYFIIVGLLEDDPYEVFAGKNGFIPKGVKTAVVKKMKRGVYQATLDDGEVVDSIADHIEDDQEAVTRLVSANLRHGTDLSYVVHQLEKTKGDLTSFSKAIARALKKHIPDGVEVSGEQCPDCNGKLHRQEGCINCVNCPYSKCG
jgi:ribonucleoside-diphosphate reductase alpha chain